MHHIINFPYKIYPKAPFSGYYDINSYNKEIFRMNTCIDQLYENIKLTKEKILFHLTIGAPIEEINDPQLSNSQWRQLHPSHLDKATQKKLKVIHYIVSPNHNMNINDDTQFKEPEFTKKIHNLHKIQNGHYTHDYLTSQIFYTMMPSSSPDHNIIVDNLQTRLDKNIFDPQILTQTPHDILFVKNFYFSLKRLIDLIIHLGGIVTCFSFAVFNEKHKELSKLKNYFFFKEITEIFSHHDYNKSILCEWHYILDQYLIYTHPNIHQNNKQYILTYDDQHHKKLHSLPHKNIIIDENTQHFHFILSQNQSTKSTNN